MRFFLGIGGAGSFAPSKQTQGAVPYAPADVQKIVITGNPIAAHRFLLSLQPLVDGKGPTDAKVAAFLRIVMELVLDNEAVKPEDLGNLAAKNSKS